MTQTIAAPTRFEPQALLDLLERQLGLFQQLSQLSAQQGQIIDQQQTDTLLVLLGQRQQLITQLTDLKERLAPFRTQWNQTLDLLNNHQRQQASRLVSQAQDYLTAIMQQDERDRGQLILARDRIGDELKQMSRASHAVHAYTPSTRQPAVPRYTNRQG